MESTSSSRASVGYKKLSVLATNQSIMFGTERRFKQNGSPELSTKTKTFRKTKASQFRANRIFNKSPLSTIIEDETPGVGEYVLPSIWDKY